MVAQGVSTNHYPMLIGGEWVERTESPIEVINKYTGEVIATVSEATDQDVERALAAADGAAETMASMPAYERAAILRRAEALLLERKEEFARVIALEAGKGLKFARTEVDRAAQTLGFSAEEARQIHGETVPMDASPRGVGKLGFWIRTPIGVVAAITPFNFPLNLVVHKVGPALAAGNPVILKPASYTPITSYLLAQVLVEAGVPAGAINVVFGPGGRVGGRIAADNRTRKVTFTGSAEVGQRLIQTAGIKKVTLELGNASPVIVDADADVEAVARKCAVASFYNSGQVCISVQRIFVHREIFDAFSERMLAEVELLKVGDPLDEATDVGPMIDVGEAIRVDEWVREASAGGARVLTGGRREGPVYYPTVLDQIQPDMKVVCQEIFGPVTSLIPFDDFEQALEEADKTQYGLQAGIFTKDINKAFRAVRKLNYGGVMINEVPAFRVDNMPYGGNRLSGLGREGVRYAMEDMTNLRMVVINEG